MGKDMNSKCLVDLGKAIPSLDDVWSDVIESDTYIDLKDDYYRVILEREGKTEEDDIDGDMLSEALDMANDDFEQKYHEIVDILYEIFDKDGIATIYREICVEDPFKFVENIKEGDVVGVSWASDAEHAISYKGMIRASGVVFVGRISCDDVDFKCTVLKFLNIEEYEICVDEGADIFIEKAMIRDACSETFKKDLQTIDVKKWVKA